MAKFVNFTNFKTVSHEFSICDLIADFDLKLRRPNRLSTIVLCSMYHLCYWLFRPMSKTQ